MYNSVTELTTIYKQCSNVITFRVRRIAEAKCIVVKRVCVSVCLCVCPSPHCHTTALHGPGCKLRNGMGAL